MKLPSVTLPFALSLAALTAPLHGESATDPTSPAPKSAKGSSNKQGKSETGAKTEDSPKPDAAPKLKISFSEFRVPGNAIALTFDDGPHAKNTPRLLDMLKERNIKVTFFLIGKNAAAYPDIVKRIVAEGHELGNHTWTHPILSHLSTAKVTEELQKTQDAIVKACGVEPKFYRPPYGAITLSQKKWIWEKFHYTTILWDVDTLDWKAPKLASKVHDTILRDTHSGSMILCHDIHETTIDAMPSTLDELKAKGFTFLTVSQMIALEAENPPKPVTPVVASPGATPPAPSTTPIPPGATILPAEPVPGAPAVPNPTPVPAPTEPATPPAPPSPAPAPTAPPTDASAPPPQSTPPPPPPPAAEEKSK